MNKVTIRKWLWLKYQDVYIDSETRISYGCHFSELGYSYWLQRNINGKWKKTAWTYFGGTVKAIYDYLIYKEKDRARTITAFADITTL